MKRICVCRNPLKRDRQNHGNNDDGEQKNQSRYRNDNKRIDFISDEDNKYLDCNSEKYDDDSFRYNDEEADDHTLDANGIQQNHHNNNNHNQKNDKIEFFLLAHIYVKETMEIRVEETNHDVNEMGYIMKAKEQKKTKQ